MPIVDPSNTVTQDAAGADNAMLAPMPCTHAYLIRSLIPRERERVSDRKRNRERNETLRKHISPKRAKALVQKKKFPRSGW